MYEILTDPEKEWRAEGLTGRFKNCLGIMAREAKRVTSNTKSQHQIDRDIRALETDFDISGKHQGELGNLIAFVADYIMDGLPTAIHDYKTIKFSGKTLTIGQAINFFVQWFEPETSNLKVQSKLQAVYKRAFGGRLGAMAHNIQQAFASDTPVDIYLTPTRANAKRIQAEAQAQKQQYAQEDAAREHRQAQRQQEREAQRNALRKKYGLQKK